MDTTPRFQRRFLPFEKAVLTAVHAALPDPAASLMAGQIGSINRIQRLLEWREIEFYCMRWFRVAWQEAVKFPARGEFELARVTLSAPHDRFRISVLAVGGIAFSLECEHPMRGLADAADVTVGDVRILRDPSAA